MRILFLLTITLLGGVAGFFVGGYAYDFGRPVRTGPTVSVAVPDGTGSSSQLRGLRVAHRGVADALERHTGRHPWLIGGALAGVCIGFLGTVLASRVGRDLGRRGTRPSTPVESP